MSDREDLGSLRRAFARGPAIALAPETCPAPETLWSALHGELSPTEIRQVVDHTASCSACAEDWRLGLEMEREAEVEDDEEELGLAPASRPHLVRFRAWLAAPLAAAAAFLIAILQWGGGQVPQPATSVLRGYEVTFKSLVPEMAALPPSQVVLRCESRPQADSYEILVGTLDQPNLSTSKKLAKCEYQVPENLLAGLPRPTRLIWQVDAVLGDRHETSSSYHVLVN